MISPYITRHIRQETQVIIFCITPLTYLSFWFLGLIQCEHRGKELPPSRHQPEVYHQASGLQRPSGGVSGLSV